MQSSVNPANRLRSSDIIIGREVELIQNYPRFGGCRGRIVDIQELLTGEPLVVVEIAGRQRRVVLPYPEWGISDTGNGPDRWLEAAEAQVVEITSTSSAA